MEFIFRKVKRHSHTLTSTSDFEVLTLRLLTSESFFSLFFMVLLYTWYTYSRAHTMYVYKTVQRDTQRCTHVHMYTVGCNVCKQVFDSGQSLSRHEDIACYRRTFYRIESERLQQIVVLKATSFVMTTVVMMSTKEIPALHVLIVSIR